MENNQSDLTGQTLPGAAHVEASGGATAAEQSLSLADLEATLGKKFPDKATALKAVKDTFSFVGTKQVAANPAPAVETATQEQLKALQEQVFYATNPQYKGHEPIIKAMGSNPAEVVGTDVFKSYMEKAQVADEVSKTKSVVASNSRLGAPKSVQDEALNVANASGTSRDDVAGVFAKALTEALTN